MYKICQVIFSTNRLEYLIPTLIGQSNLDFTGCKVDKFFFDDYPKTRNDNSIKNLVNAFGYNNIVLHKENKGLSATWTEFWDLIKDKSYDYIWHQEEDVVVLEPIKILDVINLLNTIPNACQVQLARNAWYYYESEPTITSEDIVFKDFRYANEPLFQFSILASLYSAEIARINYKEYCDTNLNEGIVAQILRNHYNKTPLKIRNKEGKALVKHIGEYFVGKRVLPGEPGYEQFEKYDPDKKYYSKDGAPYNL